MTLVEHSFAASGDLKLVFWLALTLTLSPGARGQLRCRVALATDRLAHPASGFAKTRRKFLPLPGGEGRGEGGRQINSFCAEARSEGGTKILDGNTQVGFDKRMVAAAVVKTNRARDRAPASVLS
jgi:hypothetical protein